jgi:hypothetical protein
MENFRCSGFGSVNHKPNTGDVGSCPDPHLTVLGFHLFKSSGFNGHFDITVKL